MFKLLIISMYTHIVNVTLSYLYKGNIVLPYLVKSKINKLET